MFSGLTNQVSGFFAKNAEGDPTQAATADDAVAQPVASSEPVAVEAGAEGARYNFRSILNHHSRFFYVVIDVTLPSLLLLMLLQFRFRIKFSSSNVLSLSRVLFNPTTQLDILIEGGKKYWCVMDLLSSMAKSKRLLCERERKNWHFNADESQLPFSIKINYV